MMQTVCILLAIVLLLYGIVLLVPAFVFIFSQPQTEVSSAPKTKMSLLLPVRNEEKNIGACLESILLLDYPKELLEIIVINDHSNDRTKEIAEEFNKQFSQLRVLSNSENSFGKKNAITLGVNSAVNELIVTTDGDCILPPKWLNKIAAVYEKGNPVFIAGPVAYKKKRSIFRDLLQIEQVVLQLISGGAMKMGNPIMCSGANLAYKKDFFIESGGYTNDAFASGDDIFLMFKAQKIHPGRLRFLDDREAIVLTDSAQGLKAAIQQRSRWLSKFSSYRSLPVIGTGICVFLANFMLPVLGFISLWKPYCLEVFIYAFCGKMLIDLLLLSLAVPFYREPRLLLLAPLGEVYYPFQAIISAAARLTGSFSWKGRNWKT